MISINSNVELVSAYVYLSYDLKFIVNGYLRDSKKKLKTKRQKYMTEGGLGVMVSGFRMCFEFL